MICKQWLYCCSGSLALYVLNGGTLYNYDLGGAYIQALETGSASGGNATNSRRCNVINNDLTVVGGASFGYGITARGNSGFGGVTTFATGTAAAPSITFSGDSDTGDDLTNSKYLVVQYWRNRPSEYRFYWRSNVEWATGSVGRNFIGKLCGK